MKVLLGIQVPHSPRVVTDAAGNQRQDGFGPAAHADPCVYEHPIPSSHEHVRGFSGSDLALHLARNSGPVTHLPGQEAALKVVQDFKLHSPLPATWVRVEPDGQHTDEDADDLERLLAEYYGCARGIPADVEATHWTAGDAPPGVDSGRFSTTPEAQA